MRNGRTTKATLLPIFVLCLTASLPEAVAQTTTTTAGRQVILPPPPIEKLDIKVTNMPTVTATLPASSDRTVARIDETAISLRPEKVTILAEDRLSDLLEAGGITPDVNVLSLIYDLNPTIADIKALPPGTTLILPRIEGDIRMEMAARSGYRVSLGSSATEKAEVNNKAQDLKRVSDSLALVDSTRFRNPDDKAAITRALESAQNALKIIGSNRFPVSRKVLQQSSLEAESLKLMVLKTISSQEPWSLNFRADVEKASASLKAKSDNLVAGGSAQVSVEVITKRRADGAPVPHLRVFYAPEFNLESVKKFADPTTPTSEALPMSATFTFWAGEGDDSSNKLSDTLTTTVDKDHRHITLLITK